MDKTIILGGGGEHYQQLEHLHLALANRHGLIAGATGTGKTVTLQIMAEGFAAAGVPVFLTDVKGDLAGLSRPGDPEGKNHASFMSRAQTIGYDLSYRDFDVIFWDLYGQKGHPIRTTISEMGPVLLARLLELSEAQEGVMTVAFHFADAQGLKLLDLKDLQALLRFMAEEHNEISKSYGLVSPQSLAAIQRSLLRLETEGGDVFFGEPALELADFMRLNAQGEGVISILTADRLINSPRLYATFLLWLMSELFETLPEVGDLEKPRLVFFFDEAHLLFDDAPKALVDKIEQVARLIRSKGVGIYFVTQSPSDVPESVLSQLGNRIQHALRAFTAKDQKNLRLAAQTYRPNPRFNIEEAIRDVGTGEAVISPLQPKGIPGMAERCLIRPPLSQVGPISSQDYMTFIKNSPVFGKYDQRIDSESAWEVLAAKQAAAQDGASVTSDSAPPEFNRAKRYSPSSAPAAAKPRASASRSDSAMESFAKSFARQLGSKSGQAVVRGVLGTLFKK